MNRSALVRLACLASLLVACGTPPSRGAVSYSLSIEQAMVVPEGRARIYFQGGERYDRAPPNRRRTYCSLRMHALQEKGSDALRVPSGEIAVTRVRRVNDFSQAGTPFFFYVPIEEQPGAVTYSTIFTLHSDTQPLLRTLICERWEGGLGDFYPRLRDIRDALGTHVELIGQLN